MDEQQAARWAAAQREVVVGLDDPVAAARQQLQFLVEVDRRRWLYDGPLLDRAIHRYKACCLPLLAKHTQAAVVEGPLVVPLDCEWIWHCHRLNPVQYIRDCKKVYGTILDNDKVESSTRETSKLRSEKVWMELYPEEPFELEYNISSHTSTDVNSEFAEGISYDLVAAVKRQTSFCYQVATQTMYYQRFLEEAFARYKGFLYLIKMNQDKGMQLFRVPTYDVDLMWHTHQLHPVTYRNDMLKLLGRVLEHDDTDADRSEGKKLDVGFTGTTEQFESTFGVRYWKAGAMYRGNLPSPVTSTPHVFSGEGGNGHVCEVEKHLNIIELVYVELFLQIVDIKNLAPAIPKESVYVWFTKNQPDKFISYGGRLDIVAITGKSIGVGLKCEPYGELVLTLMADHGSKKPEQLGKVSVPLKELTGPDSVFSFERWFDLKANGVHATSPPISLRVAASSTGITSAQHVLGMIKMEPFSLTTCLFPQSIKEQKMNTWTGFEYDFGTELIRLQLREHKAKDGIAFIKEIVGIPKSSKKQFQLAEFKDNRWTLTDSTLSISDDIKPSSGDDGCILQLKGGNKLVKLYRGRRLEYERTCCNHHSEDASAVTAVRFTAQKPYGKAIALLDTKSQLIMVDETWFLVPWIVLSFLLTETGGGKDDSAGELVVAGAMVKKDAVSVTDSNMVPDAGNVVASGGANGLRESAGGCGGGCSGSCGPAVVTTSAKDSAIIMASEAGAVVASGGAGANGRRESAARCGGACGSMVGNLNTKAGHAKSGGCGDAMVIEGGTTVKSGGCGSGCGSGCGGGCGGGAMVVEGSVKGSNVKSGGCGSGCGGGCGGGCGAMVVEGSKGTDHGTGVKAGGCGSGCGSGCGGGCGTMLKENAVAGQAKSGGCGSGCGGGDCGGDCGAMFKESTVAGEAKCGGCGSGCGGGGCGGGGCGAVFKASTVTMTSEAKAGGCGSGCGGGGCGAMLKERATARSGGCGSGCGGGGCGNGGTVINGSNKGSHATSGGGCGSGCGGGCGAVLMS